MLKTEDKLECLVLCSVGLCLASYLDRYGFTPYQDVLLKVSGIDLAFM